MFQLENLFEEFIFYSKCRGLTEKTIKKYTAHFSIFEQFLESNNIATLEKLNSFVIRRFMHHLLEEGKAESYVNSFLRTIRAFFKFCEVEDLIEFQKNPCLKVNWIKQPEVIIQPFSDEEVIQMIKCADRTKYQKSKTAFSIFLSERDRLLLMILADTGVRCNELCNIKLSHFSNGSIFIEKGKGKKQRVVYASDLVTMQFYRYQRAKTNYMSTKSMDESEYLLVSKDGSKLTVDAVQRVVKRVARLAGVREEIRSSPHTFRHFASTKLLENTDNIYAVSRILGHSRVSTTEQYIKTIANEKYIADIKRNSPLSNL